MRPMLDLHRFCMIDVRFAAEEPGRIRDGLRLAVEGVQRTIERGGNHLLQCREVLPLLGPQAKKLKSFGELLSAIFTSHASFP